MYVYYRATNPVEATNLKKNFQLTSDHGVTYWTNGVEPANLYKVDSRVIVRITTAKPIPAGYSSVAYQDDGTLNHVEWKVPKEEFNKLLAVACEDVEIVI